ncbi:MULTISPECIES: hypothetical protein [Proteus]|uniref:Virulence factor Evf domain-containing protein n=1 Tax=Proteus penneri TaxID=102862 RepID=A0A0G4Q9X4_9GAMM|nr:MULTISPECIES: hypothetical protein [Proteus]MBJ2116377.1 hypothetical protein [Proteus penneri]NBM13235.1 hypothetical protein [Proteus sp. G2670]NBM34308.1 hypothetical protein [Proteus sp. G2664]NBM67841.1 hypothetical protein [Proteus sp. G2663]NBN03182.1 hypothetical protein [Proteus sp. G2665]
MTNKQSDLLKNIMNADHYFAEPVTPPFPQTLSMNALHSQNIKDSEGLVQFIIASPKPFEPSEIEKMSQLKNIQIGLISIMANHLAALKKEDNEAYYRPEHWLDTLNHLPLLGHNKVETKKLHKQTFDFSVAQAFIQLLLGAAINATSPALGEFIDFLRTQGQKIEIGLQKSLDSYQTITIAGITEILNHNNHLIFVPKLKILSLRFSYQSAKMLLASCIGSKFTLSLEYTTITSIFDTSALDDPLINQQFYDFLNKYRQLSIAKSDAFFSGDFYLK